MSLKKLSLNYDELLTVINELQFKKDKDTSNGLEKMIFNELLNFSKRELELLSKNEFTDDTDFYEKFKLLDSPILLSTLIEKRAFWNKFSNYTHWITDVINEPSNELYQLMFKIENYLSKDNSDNDLYFIDFIHQFCFDMNTDEKKILINRFYHDWFDRLEKDIVHNLIRSAPTTMKRKNNESNIYHFYLEIFKEKKFNVHKTNINSLLPNDDGISPFFISLISLNKIKFLSQFNLFIDDTSYKFNNKSLYQNIMDRYSDYKNDTDKEVFDIVMTQVHNFDITDPETEKALESRLFQILDSIDGNTKNIILYNKSNAALKTTTVVKAKVNKI